MRIPSRKATLHRLLRPGVRWRWGEVVAGHTASSDEEHIDQERAAMRRHQEARERLRDLGWTDADVGTLEDAVTGYADFARCVADEIQWARGDR